VSATTDVLQRDAALKRANDRRMGIARLREQIRRGEVTLAEILADPPDLIENWTCADVVRLQWSRRASTPAMERLGRLAVRDRVNLFMPMGRTSLATRAWVARHASWNVHPCGNSTRLVVEVGERMAS
jgi:hypothetical protein